MAVTRTQPDRPLFSAFPAAQGLYDPGAEKDACGVAFVATLTGAPAHTIVEQALTSLCNLEHRGASGAEVATGDGAGILTQIPDAFLRAVAGLRAAAGRALRRGRGVPARRRRRRARRRGRGSSRRLAAEEGLAVLGWRDLPTRPEGLGPTAR